ncbi:cystathionine beta-lyase, chloroplastic-like isoform X2 [Castanea sativa]
MAALAAVSHLVGTGDEIVAGDDLYGGTDRLLSKTIPKKGIVVKRVNTSDLDEVASAIGPRTKLVWLETPTNPRQQISDIRKIAEMAHAHGALLMVDNSIMSPVLSKPLTLGADIVMHSATKFIANQGCIKPLCDLLICPDPRIVTVCLEGLENILKVGEAHKNSGSTGDVNLYAQMIDDAEIVAVEKLIAEAYLVIDKAVRVGALHRNTGARRKSRLAQRKKAVEIHHGWYTSTATVDAV